VIFNEGFVYFLKGIVVITVRKKGITMTRVFIGIFQTEPD